MTSPPPPPQPSSASASKGAAAVGNGSPETPKARTTDIASGTPTSAADIVNAQVVFGDSFSFSVKKLKETEGIALIFTVF